MRFLAGVCKHLAILLLTGTAWLLAFSMSWTMRLGSAVVVKLMKMALWLQPERRKNTLSA